VSPVVYLIPAAHAIHVMIRCLLMRRLMSRYQTIYSYKNRQELLRQTRKTADDKFARCTRINIAHLTSQALQHSPRAEEKEAAKNSNEDGSIVNRMKDYRALRWSVDDVGLEANPSTSSLATGGHEQVAGGEGAQSGGGGGVIARGSGFRLETKPDAASASAPEGFVLAMQKGSASKAGSAAGNSGGMGVYGRSKPNTFGRPSANVRDRQSGTLV
jgi:hypothetical protein